MFQTEISVNPSLGLLFLCDTRIEWEFSGYNSQPDPDSRSMTRELSHVIKLQVRSQVLIMQIYHVYRDLLVVHGIPYLHEYKRNTCILL